MVCVSLFLSRVRSCFNPPKTLTLSPGDDLSESFLVIPSGSEPVELKKQNAALKVELANMHKQLEMADKMLLLREKQDQQLRNSIYQATREVRQQLSAHPLPTRTVN